MNIEAVLTPAYLKNESLRGKTVVVFDVLRATTTITAAFAAGVYGIQTFADLDAAKKGVALKNPRPILCGELNVLPAPGVDLGNSPRQFLPEHAGREIYMSTTNGTKALAAAKSASALFTGALINASAVARAVAETRADVLLLGSGTAGEVSMEDAIGAGSVCEYLMKLGDYTIVGDVARMARRLFLASRDQLPTVLRDCQGGRNCIRAGLEADIDYVARLDALDIVGVVNSETLYILPEHRSPKID